MPHHDPVLRPQHYAGDGTIECIDAIRAMLGPVGFAAYCRGSAIKYLWRAGRKENAREAEDYDKALFFVTFLGPKWLDPRGKSGGEK